ncbi:hypothetical protein [Streptococcus mutans]|uniref:hypothetical protein n=1 Tax=Streptococcus mutans TaxID=1309 RepID=UPI0002B5BF70|nr:hypothetical protein [Streptococcus mutans]EMC42331.1 hypothetical protein SMU98_08058 [Streptococcus mutans SM1]
MAMEEKTIYLNNVKKTTAQLGELLNAEKWKEANEISKSLNELLKAQPDELTRGDMEHYHLDDIAGELRRFWYAYKEMCKHTGALRKKGPKFMDFANIK